MKQAMIPIILLLMLTTPDVQARGLGRQSICGQSPDMRETLNFTGKILTATYADMEKGTKSEIVVAGPDGKVLNAIILDTTTMYDEKGQPITRGNLVKGKSVKVKYTISNTGICEARTIKLMIP